MYTVKGDWVGQTLALARCNDSGGRKSRIRRSKEERKAMVESFIKRYQSLNDGNFPSLNVTHKEVGGSFYTVREIVRDIIQENKVLGPSRCNSEVVNNDIIVEHYPLGSSSADPQGVLFQRASKLNNVSNHQEYKSVELILGGNGQYTNHQDLDSVQFSSVHQSDEGENPHQLACTTYAGENLVMSSHQEHVSLKPSLSSNRQCLDGNKTDDSLFVNGIQTDGICEESSKQLSEGSPVSEKFEAQEESELIGPCEAKLTLPTEEVVVETFPLRSARKETDDTGTTSTNSGNLDGTLSYMETKEIKLGNGSPEMETSSCLDDLAYTKGTVGSEFPISDSDTGMLIRHEKINGMVIEQREVNLIDNVLDVSHSRLVIEDSAVLTHDHPGKTASHSDSTMKTAEERRKVEGFQRKNAAKGTTFIDNSNGTSSKNADKEQTFMVNGNDSQRDNKAVKENSPTLDRIHLESWEGTSKTRLTQDANPLMVFFKAFMDAFAKFWSE